MGSMEDLDLLKAAIAVAVADGEIRGSEKGVLEGLAERVGVGRVSFEAMLEVGGRDDSIDDSVLRHSVERAHRAFELLVAQARIDGEISHEERAVLVRIAASLGITGDDFERIYRAGIRRADGIRKSRQQGA